MRKVILVAVLTAVAVFESRETAAARDVWNSMIGFLTPAGFAAIERPARVELARVRLVRAAKAAPTVAGYPVEGAYTEVPGGEWDSLRRLLLAPTSYPTLGSSGYTGKGCPFRPGYTVRFTPSGKPRARPFEMLFCFSCEDVGVVLGKKEVHIDMSAMSQELAKALLRILPDDADLKEIVSRETREPLIGR